MRFWGHFFPVGQVASTLETEHFRTGELVALAWAFARTRPRDRDVQVVESY